MKTLLCTAAMGLALAVGPALAQTTPPAANDAASGTAATAQTELSQQDRAFVEKAAESGLMEVKLGELASGQAASQDVKMFGQRMIDDHSRANTELGQIAKKKTVEMPTELSPEHQEMREQLSGLSGEAFDRDYIRHMVAAHEKDIELFERQASEGEDAELKRFAESTLPVLEQHLDMARDIQQQMQPVASAGAADGERAGSGDAGASQPAQVTVVPADGAASGTETGTATATTTAAATPEIDARIGQMTAEELIGKDVVNAQGEEIGEIEDVVIGSDQSMMAIISVGGFLGLGAKEVGVPMHQLRIGANDAVMMSEMSEDELKELPPFSDPNFEALPRDRRILER